MPCVCLRNTFKYWQVLKAQKLAQQSQRHPRKTLASSASLVQPSAYQNLSSAHVTLSPLPLSFESKPSYADLINAESRLGSSIFGPIPAGHRREFFHDRENVWIWHEDWQDTDQRTRQFTVRYEVRTSGIYKKVATGKYLKLEGDELANFRRATHAYLYLVKKYLYKTPQLQHSSI